MVCSGHLERFTTLRHIHPFIHTHIHTPTAESATQGHSQLVGEERRWDQTSNLPPSMLYVKAFMRHIVSSPLRSSLCIMSPCQGELVGL